MTHFQSHLHNLTPDSKKVLVNSLTFRKHENHNIHNSDLYKERFWLFQSFFSVCVCIYEHMTNNFRHFIYHLFLFFSWLYKKSQRTHFEWHKIVFLHQQDESQKAFMMWKEKEKAVVRQLTQELD